MITLEEAVKFKLKSRDEVQDVEQDAAQRAWALGLPSRHSMGLVLSGD